MGVNGNKPHNRRPETELSGLHNEADYAALTLTKG